MRVVYTFFSVAVWGAVLVVSGAGCNVPTSPDSITSPGLGTAATAFSPAAEHFVTAAAASTAQTGRFVVPHGGPTTLVFDTGAAGIVTGLRFVFGGHHELKIVRIDGGSGVPGVQFLDASPSDVTRFFQSNPVVTDSSVFQIDVTNPTSREQGLEVVAVWRE